MRKEIIFLITMLVLLIPAGVNGEGCWLSDGCETIGAKATPIIVCPDATSCGDKVCKATYTPLYTEAIGACETETAEAATECASCEANCNLMVEIGCSPTIECYPAKNARDLAALTQLGSQLPVDTATAKAAQAATLAGGNFVTSIVPCTEMVSCFMQAGAGSVKTAQGLTCGTSLTSEAVSKMVSENPQIANDINKFALENIDKEPVLDGLIKSKFKLANAALTEKIANLCPTVGCGKTVVEAFLDLQSEKVLADAGVRAAMSQAGYSLSWMKQLFVLEQVITSNPYVKAATYLYAIGSTVFGLLKPDPEPVQKQYYQQNYIVAQNDINEKTASDSTGLGTSAWVQCQNHRDVKCAKSTDCFKDLKQGAVQCAVALPNSEQVKVTFSSINVIDKEEINMYTLTGEENTGVVYEENGFVNIDKGGTTKVQVAGDGAYISDVNNNLLVLDKGTTTYYGTGNEFEDVYVTNTYVLDLDTMISFNSLNSQEQAKYRERNSKNRDINELAITFGKGKPADFKNAIDEKKSGFSSEITTRGFSNTAILEKRQYFPFVTRIFAKGDSRIVKNQNVVVESQHKVNDEKYTYMIKSDGRSTKVYNANGFILEDSGQLMRELSKRQLFMLYNRTI